MLLSEYAIHNYIRQVAVFPTNFFATLAQMRLNKDLNLGPHD